MRRMGIDIIAREATEIDVLLSGRITLGRQKNSTMKNSVMLARFIGSKHEKSSCALSGEAQARRIYATFESYLDVAVALLFSIKRSQLD